MLPPEQVARIRRLFFAEHWKIGTIASELGVHRSAVCHALYRGEKKMAPPRPTPVDPYVEFLGATLEQHPKLVSTRLFEMIRLRGYAGSHRQLKRKLQTLRVVRREAFLRLRMFPGEQAQVDWAHFGHVTVGRARRSLMAFVMTLSYSRALYVEFFFDQSQESFLLGHVRAFEAFGGAPRETLYDNLRSAVLERCGQAIRFHPRLLELSAHYHFEPRACQVRRGNEKGRVERAIRYVRESFFAARPFVGLQDLNSRVRTWQNSVAQARAHPEDPTKTVGQVFEQERPRLIALPQHPFDVALLLTVSSKKTIYVHFDRNDYSIPPDAVGRPLTLVATDNLVRILDGHNELARYPRSFDAHRRLESPAHIEALLKLKRAAAAHSCSARLLQAVPQAEAFLDAAFRRGEPAASQVTQLLALLREYGPVELRQAIDEALQRQTARASSVAYLLQKRRRQIGHCAPLPVDLSRHPDLADLDVTPHEARIYDELSRPSDD